MLSWAKDIPDFPSGKNVLDPLPNLNKTSTEFVNTNKFVEGVSKICLSCNLTKMMQNWITAIKLSKIKDERTIFGNSDFSNARFLCLCIVELIEITGNEIIF